MVTPASTPTLSGEEEDCSVGDAREDETIGAARKRRKRAREALSMDDSAAAPQELSSRQGSRVRGGSTSSKDVSNNYNSNTSSRSPERFRRYARICPASGNREWYRSRENGDVGGCSSAITSRSVSGTESGAGSGAGGRTRGSSAGAEDSRCRGKGKGRSHEREGTENVPAAAAAATATAAASLAPREKSIAGMATRKEMSGQGSKAGGPSAGKSQKSNRRLTTPGEESRKRQQPQKKKNQGIFGIPVNWNVEDCDYDDSEDESYAPSASGSSSALSATALAAGPARRTRTRQSVSSAGGVQEGEAGLITGLSVEVVLTGIVRPYLSAVSKCALQRTCKQMRRLVDMPQAWQTLSLRADVIGRRTMKSGRMSIMSKQPLFFLARGVALQPRFSLVTAVDLRGLNLGAMGSTPDLLVTLFDNCRQITTLNLWKTYVEDEGLPQPDSSVEKVLAERLPGVQHLALEMDASNRGLKLLLEGCRRLRSLHIGSRRNRRGDSISMYPNDLGMKAFILVGAPCLETLCLVDKVNIGAAGLRHVLDESSCPLLKTLILARTSRVNDNCLKAITQSMGRITSITLDQCPVKPATVQFVVERCPELSRLVVCTKNGIIEQPQEGRALLEFLLVNQNSTKLAKVNLERLSTTDHMRKGSNMIPRWLAEDFPFHSAVLDCTRPRIVIGGAETADERIRPFMAGT